MEWPWILLVPVFLAAIAAIWGRLNLYDRWRRRGEAGRLTGWVDMHTHPMSHHAEIVKAATLGMPGVSRAHRPHVLRPPGKAPAT